MIDVGDPQASQQHAPTLIGRYALYEKIATGGMASVHIGRLLGPVGFARTVAIKRMHPQFAGDPDFVSMFLDEARLAARIRHPNVVPTLDVVTVDGELFLVMEYVQGESLSRLLRGTVMRRQRIPPSTVATIMVGVLHGLHAAHEAKNDRGQPLCIVHRDVSPHNVLVGADGVPRVLDFGVAKAMGRMQTTRSGQLKGKISYMAPEQISGGELSRASDIYSASVVLWESLTSKRMFSGENEATVMANVLKGCPVPPSQLAPGLPPELDALTMRGLSLEPALRFATAREMARALENAVTQAPASVVGEWVEALAKETLDERGALVESIETDSSVIAPSVPPPVSTKARIGEVRHSTAAGEELPTQLSSGSVSAPASVAQPVKRRRGVAPIAVAAVGLAIAGSLAFALTRQASSGRGTIAATVPPEVPASGAPSSSASPASSAVPESSASAVATTAPDSAAAAASASTAAPRSPHHGGPNPVPQRFPVPSPTATHATPPAAQCNPPYYFNSQGVRVFKPECL